MANYWRAIRDLLVEDGDETSVIFKTNGLHLFHGASPAIFLHLANIKNFQTDKIRDLLKKAFENLPTEFIAMSSSAFWKRGGHASGMNQAAMRKYAAALATAINSHAGSEGVAL